MLVKHAVEQKTRKQWIEASRFHDLDDRQVLDHVLESVRKGPPGGQVLLDLDSTLYEVGHRTYQILKEWRESRDAQGYPRIHAALQGLRLDHVGYSLKDTFQALGFALDDPEILAMHRQAKGFWTSRFFSSEYLKFDRPYSGASDFVRDLHRAGAAIVYLTGRDEEGMGRGTREILARDGFPVGERIDYVLKPTRLGDDHEHKVVSSRKLRERGPILASFENEPRNLMSIARELPGATHVFVETHCSDHPADPADGIYRIRGYL